MLCLLFFLVKIAGTAENLNNARAFALGGAYSCLARGAESSLWNPANLSYNSGNRLSISILGFGVSAYNNAFNNRHYVRYNGAYLDQAAKADILNILPDNGLHVNIRSDIQTIGIGFGPFAFTVQGRAAGEGTMDKDLFDLAFYGNQLDRLYTLEPANGSAVAMETVSFSYGHYIPTDINYISHLGVGATLKYVHGEYYSHILHSKARTITRLSSAEAAGELSMRTATGGNGISLDIGMTVIVNEKLHLSLCADNLLSSVNWNHNPQQALFDFELFAPEVGELLIQSDAVDSIFISNDSTFDIHAFSTTLPQSLRLGAMYKITRFVLTAELYQGFAKTAFTSTLPRMALGSEYTPAKWLRLRLGQTIGGEQFYMFSYGFGLVFGPFRWDISGRSIRGFPIGAAKGIGAATSMFLFF